METTNVMLPFREGGPAEVEAGRVVALSAANLTGNARVELRGADRPAELDEQYDDAVRRVDEVLRRTGRRLEAEAGAAAGWNRAAPRRVVRPHRRGLAASEDGLLRIVVEQGQYAVEQKVWISEGDDPRRAWRHLCYAVTRERVAEIWRICTGETPELP